MRTDSYDRLALRWLTLCIGFVAATVFAAAIPLFWHDKLYLDGFTIIHTPPGLTAFGSSFPAAAFLLSPLLGLLGHLGVQLDTYGLVYGQDLLVANTFFGGVFFAGFFVQVFSYRLKTTPSNLLLFLLLVVLFAPFFYVVTKELLLFALTLAVLLAYRAGLVSLHATSAAYAGLLLLFGVYFRIYYIAFAALFVVHWLSLRRVHWLLAFYVVAAIALVVLHGHLPLDLLGKGRANYLEGVSSSRIEYYLGDDSAIGFVGNRALTLLMLLAPVNLLAKSPGYIPFVGLQLLLTWHMLRCMLRPRRDIRTLAAHAMFAFTVVGALFEPDFGSYFRHKVGVLPLMLLVVTTMSWTPPSLRQAAR